MSIRMHKELGGQDMKHIKTLNTQTLNNTVKKGGCGECQTSCQSACKTSCTVGIQVRRAAIKDEDRTFGYPSIVIL